MRKPRPPLYPARAAVVRFRRWRRREPLRRFLRGDFARHGALVFASTMTVNALNYVFHFFIARRIGVDGYGALYSLLAALALLSVPATVFTMVIVRYAAEFRALGDTERLGALLSWVLGRTLVAAAALLAAGAAFQVPIAAYLRLGDSREVVAAAAVLGLGIVSPAVRGILQGVEDFRRLAASMLIETGGRTLFGVGAVYAGFGVNGAFLGQACALALCIAYSASAVARHVGARRVPLRFDGRRLLQTTLGVTGATLGLNALGSTDLLLVKHFFSPHDAGVYSVVSLVGKVMLFVVGFIPTIVLPKATARVTRGESPVPILAQAAAAIVALCALGLSALVLEPRLIVRAMSGGAFLAAAPYVLAYGLAMAMLGATTVVVSYKVGLHQFDFLVPMLAIAVCEVVAICLVHPTLGHVIRVVLVANALCLVSALYRITSVRIASPVARPGEVA